MQNTKKIQTSNRIFTSYKLIRSNPSSLFWGIIKHGLLILLVITTLSSATVTTTTLDDKISRYTRDIDFNFYTWTLQALLVKWQQYTLGGDHLLSAEKRKEIVLNELDTLSRIKRVEHEIERIYASPNISNPAGASISARTRWRDLNLKYKAMAPLTESIIQEQISQVLADEGLTFFGQPIPPVAYHATALPIALIVSPREAIRQDASIYISPDMRLDEQINLENKVAKGLNVSTFVTDIGGMGLYPTMVNETSDINWLAEVVAHEWTHNYMLWHPLGWFYDESPGLRTMNETTASITGKEIARKTVARFYPERSIPATQEESLSNNKAQVKTSTPQAVMADYITLEKYNQTKPFNINREMYKTRLMVDALLAHGKIDQAEQYMDMRRSFFWDFGYVYRKINQAYFAFYGAYADEAESAAGADPVADAVRSLRKQSPTLKQFVQRIAVMHTEDELMNAVEITRN